MAPVELNLNGYTDLPKGKVAYVVTYLEMPQKPDVGASERSDIAFERWEDPSRDEFRALFREIGEDWLWYSRLTISDEKLDGLLNDPHRQIYAPIVNGRRVGLLELNFRSRENVEISFFGLVPSTVGGGVGRWMMAKAMELAWSHAETRRVWLHTCTGDSPQAIHFYQSCGFRPFKRAIEVMDDPRLSGHVPMDKGRHVPLIA
ncbi:GNAT family N-acetyltransferase [Roseibium sp.]|uniref:GNAT family N-acetyltransferase n=1 Tax=Roseibium sp. TaxID=1936156 RepID=UPI003A97D7F2